MGRPYTCPKCHGTKTHKKGHRYTTTKGVRLIRKCGDCGYRFTTHKTPEPAETEGPQ